MSTASLWPLSRVDARSKAQFRKALRLYLAQAAGVKLDTLVRSSPLLR